MSRLRWPFPKDPQSDKKYIVEWDKFLDDGEHISSSSWVLPSGGEITSSGDGFTDDTSFIQLAGGVSGKSYTLSNTVVTNLGNTVNRGVILAVEDR